MENSRGGREASSSSFFVVYYYLLAGIILLVAAFLFVRPASAQTEEVAAPDSAAEPVSTVASDSIEPQSVASEPAVSVEAQTDNQINSADLGATDSSILPNNPLYGFKRFGRSIQEVFTFNPIKKAELRLEHANQELADAHRLVEREADNSNAIKKATEAIQRFEEKVADIKDSTEQLKEQMEKGDKRADIFLDKVLNQQIKQQKFLEKIEELAVGSVTVPEAEAVLDAVASVKQQIADHVGEVVSAAEIDPVRLTERFDRMLEQQSGSEFKDIRNLEVLKRLGDQVPRVAREAIQRAEANALNRFTRTFEQLPPTDRAERFERYARGMDGDETRYLEIFDRIKNLPNVPLEILQKMETAKDLAAQRFQTKLENFDEKFDEEFRARAMERAFARFKQGGPDMDKLRVIEDMRMRVGPSAEKMQQEMVARRNEAIEKFQEAFPDAGGDVEQFRELSEKMSQNPDSITFRLIKELEEKVKLDPNKRAFLEKIEAETKQKFIERAKTEGEQFFERVASTNPQDIEIFKQLSQESFVPPGLENVFDRMIDKQSKQIVDQIEDIKDPVAFNQLEKRFKALPPAILEEIKRRESGFVEEFKSKREFIQNMEVDQQTRAARVQLEDERRRFEEEFRARSESVQSEEERDKLETDRQNFDNNLRGREFEERKKAFEKHLEFDPFCDEGCRVEEKVRFEKKLQADRDQQENNDQFQRIERELRVFENNKRQEFIKSFRMEPQSNFNPEKSREFREEDDQGGFQLKPRKDEKFEREFRQSEERFREPSFEGRAGSREFEETPLTQPQEQLSPENNPPISLSPSESGVEPGALPQGL